MNLWNTLPLFLIKQCRNVLLRVNIIYMSMAVSLTLVFFFTTESAAGITFNFQMPRSVSFVETMTMDKTVSIGNESPTRTLTESKGRYAIQKTSNGWSVYVRPVRPLDMDAADNVGAITNSLVANMKLRYDVNNQGRLTNIDGIERGFSEISSMFPAKFRSLLPAMGINPSTLQQQLIFWWNMRGLFDMQSLSGRPITLNQPKVVSGVFPSVLEGRFTSPANVIFRGPMNCGRGDSCIKFESTAYSKDPHLGRASANMITNMISGGMKELAAIEGSKAPPVLKFSITGATEQVTLVRLISAHTGLQHRFIQSHDVEATISVIEKSGTHSSTIKIKIIYDFDFDFE